MKTEGTGLVLEGGGFRGIYTAAVLDVFQKEKLLFKYILGVSAGAAYGVSYVAGQYERNLEVNRYVSDKRYCGWLNFIGNGNYFNWDFVYQEIPANLIPFSYSNFAASGVRMQVVVTNCKTGNAEYLELDGKDTDRFRDLLIATSSLPFISRIKKIGGNSYMDGGIADAIPVRKAFRDNMHRVVVVLTRHKGYRKKQSGTGLLLKWVYRHYPEMVTTFMSRAERYNNTLDDLEQLEKEGKIFIIRPGSPLPVARMENDPDKLKRVYDAAIRDMDKIMPALQEWLKTITA
jgi:predicted patatin/cPLA2 family phospholipase